MTLLCTLDNIESLGLRRATLMIAGADFVSVAEIETSICIAIGSRAVAIWDISLKRILNSILAKSPSTATYYQIVKQSWIFRVWRHHCHSQLFFLNDMIIEIDFRGERDISN